MVTRRYRPYYFDNLWGGFHVADPTQPLVYVKRISSSDSAGGLFETGRIAWAVYNGNDFYVCSDNRSLIGNVLCRPLDTPQTLQGNTSDFYMSAFDQDTAAELDGNWNISFPFGSDAYNFITRNFPPDREVVVGGPRATQFTPDPDFALVSLGLSWTNWWGYHAGCYINLAFDPPRGQGCGDYTWWQPTIQLDAPGELRTYHPPGVTGIASIDDIVFGPDDSLGTFGHGEEEWGIDPSRTYVVSSETTADPDPTFTLPPLYTSPDIDFTIPAPLSGIVHHTDIVPYYQGLVRPPAPAYKPSPNSSNPWEAADALNVASKELWHWNDAINFSLAVRCGVTGDGWWRIAWEDFTNGEGTAILSITPFWLLHPTEEPVTHGFINAEPLANHIRQVRRRAVHDGESVAL